MAPKQKKAAEVKVTKMTVPKPSGTAPLATVQSRHGSSLVSRTGRGFSMGELDAASISMVTAGRWGLQVDVRRRSSLDANTGALRDWAASSPPKTAKVGEAKKVEEEIVKIEKEVVREAEKGAAKAKRAAKKVEKEAAAEVEKPLKARQRKKATKEKPKD